MAKLVEHMPRYYKKANYVTDTTKGSDDEILELVVTTSLMHAQFVVDTATELTLSRYEAEYGLPQNPEGVTIDVRRSRIKAKMRTAGVVTKEMMQTVIEAWANADIEITEDFANYSFTVKFVNTLGKPPHLQDLYDAVSDIMPAHLGITYEFKYRTHGELAPYTHQQLAAFTHNTLREGALS